MAATANTSSLLRASTTTTTKDEGSGSWEAGYLCPSFYIKSKGSNSYGSSLGEAKIQPTKIARPETGSQADVLGMVLDLKTAPSATLKKIMTQVGSSSSWYFPYRWISSSAKFDVPGCFTGCSKEFSFWISNDSNEHFQVKIKLPYSTFGHFISDTQGRSLESFVNNRRTEHQNNVKNAKTGITDASSTYIANKPLLTAAETKGNNLVDVKKKMNADLVSYNATLATTRTEKSKEEKEYNELTSQTATKQNKVNELSSQVDTLTVQIRTIQGVLKALEEGQSDSTKLKADLTKTTDAALVSFNNDIDRLKSKAPERITVISAITTATKTFHSETIKTNLAKIVPS